LLPIDVFITLCLGKHVTFFPQPARNHLGVDHSLSLSLSFVLMVFESSQIRYPLEQIFPIDVLMKGGQTTPLPPKYLWAMAVNIVQCH
jgi:hypothetical protein